LRRFATVLFSKSMDSFFYRLASVGQHTSRTVSRFTFDAVSMFLAEYYA
jgi:hypothetical protein